MSSQHEQTKHLRELGEAMVRVEEKLEGLPDLELAVRALQDESRDQKTTIRILKWVGGACLATISGVVTLLSTLK